VAEQELFEYRPPAYEKTWVYARQQ
jgi:hypothetical protein